MLSDRSDARDRALRAARRVTAASIAGAVGLTAALSGVAAQAVKGHGKPASTPPATPARVVVPAPQAIPRIGGGAPAPQPPAQAPAPAPSPPPVPPAVSGGS